MIASVDVSDIRIETERLILRAWKESDLSDFNEYARVEGVGEMAGWNHHESLEKSRQILELFIREKKTLALVEKQSGKVIGSLGLEDRDHDGTGEKAGREIGYVLSKARWGRGLMPEAVSAVIDYCFRELSYDWLTCGHFLWNHQSARVIQKCGFQYVRDDILETRRGTEERTKVYILYNPYK